MPRIRYIKPELFQDISLSKISANPRTSRDCVYLYEGLWCWEMDKQGVFEYSPMMIWKHVFPFFEDVTYEVFVHLLTTLMESKREGGDPRFYIAKLNKKSYAYCPTFVRNQKIHQGEQRKFPALELLFNQPGMKPGDIPKEEEPGNQNQMNLQGVIPLHPLKGVQGRY